MSIAINALFFLLLLPILVDVVLLVKWAFQNKTITQKLAIRPKVSILVAARNEGANIGQCIESLIALNYPVSLVEILIGDDGSEDDTFAKASSFLSEHPNLKVYRITKNIPGQLGKANVLAQLASNAQGEFLFFTDADIRVPPDWVEGMLEGFSPKVGLVSGVTAISGNSLWERCQRIDWLFALGMVKVANDFGYSVTAVGNNMAVSRKAYDAVGGYAAIPFSVTEDFELLKQIKQKGFKGNQLFQQNTLAWSAPEPHLHRLLHQRKRWMKGALNLPLPLVTVLAIQALFFPSLILAFFIVPLLGLFAIAAKVLCQSIFIGYAMSQVGLKENPIVLFIYECYSTALSLLLLVFYCLPIKTDWKGRKYTSL